MPYRASMQFFYLTIISKELRRHTADRNFQFSIKNKTAVRAAQPSHFSDSLPERNHILFYGNGFCKVLWLIGINTSVD